VYALFSSLALLFPVDRLPHARLLWAAFASAWRSRVAPSRRSIVASAAPGECDGTPRRGAGGGLRGDQRLVRRGVDARGAPERLFLDRAPPCVAGGCGCRDGGDSIRRPGLGDPVAADLPDRHGSPLPSSSRRLRSATTSGSRPSGPFWPARARSCSASRSRSSAGSPAGRGRNGAASRPSRSSRTRRRHGSSRASRWRRR